MIPYQPQHNSVCNIDVCNIDDPVPTSLLLVHSVKDDPVPTSLLLVHSVKQYCISPSPSSR